MDPVKINELLPDELRRLMARTDERRFVLIDVRQPQEYAVAHIPGARLMPLLELESRLFDLPADRAMIFYCSSGPRSEIAAALVSEAELSDRPVYHLIGGMLAWDGHKLADFPRFEVFDRGRDWPDMLMTAMDLEKGAFRYYQALGGRFGNTPIGPVIARLAAAEETHARSVYAFWQRDQPAPPPFETLFEKLPGEILEGGRSLAAVLAHIEAVDAEAGVQVLEHALGIEYQAYDLYRGLADRTEGEQHRGQLLALAQAEKAHMRQLTEAIAAFLG